MQQFALALLLLSLVAPRPLRANTITCSEALTSIKSTWERIAKDPKNGSGLKFQKNEMQSTLAWIGDQAVLLQDFFWKLKDGVSFEYKSRYGVSTAKIPQRVLLDFTRQIFETASRLSRQDEIDYNFMLDFSYVFSLGQLVGSVARGYKDISATTELWNSNLFKNANIYNLEKGSYSLFLNGARKHGVSTMTESQYWDDHLTEPPYALIVPTEKFLTLNDRTYLSFHPIVPLTLTSAFEEYSQPSKMPILPLREAFTLYKSSLMQLFALEKRYQNARELNKAGFMFEVTKRETSYNYFVYALATDRSLHQKDRETIGAFWHYAVYLKGHYKDLKTLPITIPLDGPVKPDAISISDFLNLLNKDLELESLIQDGVPTPTEVHQAWLWIRRNFTP